MDILQTSMYTIKTFNRLKSAKLRSYIDLYVHSIYERTINLMLDGQLIALQIADSPVSPISIILPLDETGLDRLKIKSNSPVSIDGTNLLVGKNIISLDRAYDVYDDTLCEHTCSSSLKDVVWQLIIASDRDGFSTLVKSQNTPDDIALSYAKKKLIDAESICSTMTSGNSADEPTNQLNKLCDSLSSLIGVGTGLTPGGDDFITGVLSTFKALPQRFNHKLISSLSNSVCSRRNNTNEISSAFIDCALRGQFSKAIIDLYDSVCSDNVQLPGIEQKTLDNLLDSFLDIGHTSGIDTLTGIFWSMKHLSKI
ncbi:DUF2877 domain-containing protein [Mogibacterium sp.]